MSFYKKIKDALSAKFGRARQPEAEIGSCPHLNDDAVLKEFKRKLARRIYYKQFNRIIQNQFYDSVIEDNAGKINILFDDIEVDDEFIDKFLSILLETNGNDSIITTLLHVADNKTLKLAMTRIVNLGHKPLSLSKIVFGNYLDLVELTRPVHERYRESETNITHTAVRHASPDMLRSLDQHDLLPPQNDSGRAQNLWSAIGRNVLFKTDEDWAVMDIAQKLGLFIYQPETAFQGSTAKLILLLTEYDPQANLETRLNEWFNLEPYQFRADLLSEYIMAEMPDKNEACTQIEKLLPGSLSIPTPVDFKPHLLTIADSLDEAGQVELAAEIRSNLLRDPQWSASKSKRKRIRL